MGVVGIDIVMEVVDIVVMNDDLRCILEVVCFFKKMYFVFW